ncbi:MAG: rRNA pseudouridine synthase [Lachnospiraceae bacterium]|nr:rRNA pseudouridine synthase [Lachnospiraceae bacterium]
MNLRLDKYLANSRAGSRSEVKEHIRKGRVTVNGKVCRDNSRYIEETDEVCLDGRRIVYKEHVYYMLNKPAGVVSATEDPVERTVIDLFPPELRKGLFPVGRLDKDSVGLLIITDDGEFSHRFTSPSGHVDKRYLIRTDQPLCLEDAKKFSEGITLADGTTLKSAKLEISENDPCQAEVTISEGKYHQIKRMIASCGKTVTYLKRLSMGDITLDPNLEEGEFKEL